MNTDCKDTKYRDLTEKIIGVFYEKHDVNTPPFMAGMKRHPLKTV